MTKHCSKERLNKSRSRDREARFPIRCSVAIADGAEFYVNAPVLAFGSGYFEN